MKRFLGFFVLLVSCIASSQTVIPIDEETREFITDVNYHLFLNKNEILIKNCDNDRATEVAKIPYDSIVFEKLGYHRKGFAKDDVPKEQSVFLTPATFHLDEVTLSRRLQNDTLLGEKGKIYKKGSRPMVDHLDYALRIVNPYGKKVSVRSFTFFAQKVTYKTAYKLCFYRLPNERFPMFYFELFGYIYKSDVLYLDPNQEGEVKIDLKGLGFDLPKEGVLASVELVDYLDSDGNSIVPNLKNRTMIGLQYSKKTNYFTRTADYYTKKESNGLDNINARINYDFAILNFGKVHRSNLLAPAYFLEIRP